MRIHIQILMKRRDPSHDVHRTWVIYMEVLYNIKNYNMTTMSSLLDNYVKAFLRHDNFTGQLHTEWTGFHLHNNKYCTRMDSLQICLLNNWVCVKRSRYFTLRDTELLSTVACLWTHLPHSPSGCTQCMMPSVRQCRHPTSERGGHDKLRQN